MAGFWAKKSLLGTCRIVKGAFSRQNLVIFGQKNLKWATAEIGEGAFLRENLAVFGPFLGVRPPFLEHVGIYPRVPPDTQGLIEDFWPPRSGNGVGLGVIGGGTP